MHTLGVLWNKQHPLGITGTHFVINECSHNIDRFWMLYCKCTQILTVYMYSIMSQLWLEYAIASACHALKEVPNNTVITMICNNNLPCEFA